MTWPIGFGVDVDHSENKQRVNRDNERFFGLSDGKRQEAVEALIGFVVAVDKCGKDHQGKRDEEKRKAEPLLRVEQAFVAHYHVDHDQEVADQERRTLPEDHLAHRGRISDCHPL